jgi:RNA polymerase sigma-70 factor (ECF subfamily)
MGRVVRLLMGLGSMEEAAKNYERALSLVTNESARRFLERRLEEVKASIA